VIREILVCHMVVVAAVASWAAWTGRLGPGGVLAGGGVMAFTVIAYGAVLGAVLRRGSRRLAMILLFAKFLLFLGLGWWAFVGTTRTGPDALGFAVGVTCFPAAVVWGALRARGIDGTL
jgi:hypothetical protein